MEKGIKVLLVDDQDDFRKLMKFWLESKGSIVFEAPEGKTGVKMVKEKKPDIVFMDLHMPVMGGLEALKKIREFNKDVPIIVISAYTHDPGAKEALEYGISGVFNKGNNFEEALPLLESALRTHKKLKKD
ncbi:MAG: response regulator [Candidatus Omnitrophota bacterium]